MKVINPVIIKSVHAFRTDLGTDILYMLKAKNKLGPEHDNLKKLNYAEERFADLDCTLLYNITESNMS